MTSYNAIGELNIAPTPNRAAGWLDMLAEFHPAVGRTARGGTEVIITVQAEDLWQAARVAAVQLRDALGQVDALHVMTTDDFDAKLSDVAIPQLVGATEAAVILGVTRQRVQQMAAGGQLPHTKVGNGLAFPRATLEAMAARGSTDGG